MVSALKPHTLGGKVQGNHFTVKLTLPSPGPSSETGKGGLCVHDGEGGLGGVFTVEEGRRTTVVNTGQLQYTCTCCL